MNGQIRRNSDDIFRMKQTIWNLEDKVKELKDEIYALKNPDTQTTKRNFFDAFGAKVK